LAILIFILVCVATLVIGMITKMDWARIISVCVIFGIVIGLGTILNSSAAIQNEAGMSSCLQ
jgi:type IV secretion system protein TrbC